jgi:hypothetical protein
MNCSNGLVIETDGARRENRPPHFAADARSQVGSTLETSGNRPLCLNKASDELCQLAPHATHQTVGDVRGDFTVGFSEAWRRRSIVLQEKRPWRAVWSPGSGASSTRPRPGYPLLVCSPAWPNSVSPGTVNDISRLACSFKSDKSASRVADSKSTKAPTGWC